jgi:restriction system protein
MTQDVKQVDIVFHYPPELTQLLINTIPLLCPAKRDVLTFFRGSGVGDSVLSDLEARLRKDRNSINKYEIVRTVLERLNSKGEPALRERREILRRVTEFEDFSTCWPRDQLKAKGLVGEISQHLLRVLNRGHARGIFISASDYTSAAIASCKESLTRSLSEI